MPAPLTITDTGRTAGELRRFAGRCRDHRQRRRARAIASGPGGMPPGEVAARLRTTARSIRDWTVRYSRDGIEGLADSPGTGRPGRLDRDRRALPAERAGAGPGPGNGGPVRWRLKDLAARAMARSGVSVRVSAMWRTARGIGFSHQTVRPLHPGADPGRQSGFRNGSGGLAPGAAGEGATPGRTGIRFQDGPGAGRKGTNTRIWARRGVRPRAVRDHRYGYRYLFAASHAGDPCAVGHVCGRANTDGTDVHLETVPAKVRPGNHAVVVPGGAGWHRSGALVVPGNVSLPRLPPYSPEPDPAGQVFDYLRPDLLSSRLFPTAGDVTGAMRDAWKTFGTDRERIASITKRSWARVS